MATWRSFFQFLIDQVDDIGYPLHVGRIGLQPVAEKVLDRFIVRVELHEIESSP